MSRQVGRRKGVVLGIGWLAGVVVLASLPVLAANQYVSMGGSDATGAGTTGSPWGSITNAIAQAGTGDSVFVGGGVYTQGVSITLAGKTNVTVKGGYDTSGSWSWAPASQTTVLVASNVNNSVVVIPATAVSNTLSCLTLRGATANNKAGIEFTGASALFVDGCMIVSNKNGIWNESGTATLTLRNTVIARNTAQGIHGNVNNGGTSFLYNCTVADNGSDGFYANGYPEMMPVAKNTLFTGNSGYAINIIGTGSGGSISNCLFFSNANGDTSASSGLSNLGGNKSGRDPKYSAPTSLNYQVQSDSPAAAAGAFRRKLRI